MKIECIEAMIERMDLFSRTNETKHLVGLIQQLLKMVEAAVTTLKAIAADPETYEGIVAKKCLAELKRLEDE